MSHVPCVERAAYPLRAGNRVVPLIDGEPAFRRICEAIEGARKRVWGTVAFIESDCAMPDGRGTFFDVLDRAAARGVDVRVVFWDDPVTVGMMVSASVFPANEESHAWLAARGSRVRMRWDRVKDHCQHQKSWIVDAGEAGESAFVGGINVDAASMVAPGHASGSRYLHYEGVHDVYLEVQGPASTDIAHNFVQRWNGASERGKAFGAYPSLQVADDVAYPRMSARAAGDVAVHVSRSILPGLYSGCDAAPGADPFDIADGEFSIGAQYLAAVQAAREAIYLENQIYLCPGLFAALQDALARGVEVVAVAPPHAMPEICRYKNDPRMRPILDGLAALAREEHFTMAALAAPRDGAGYADIYVHSKVAIVDDVWATVGSANAMVRSWRGDTEMNASFWDAGQARALRTALFAEHLGADGDGAPPRDALRRFAAIARDNARRRAAGERLEGLAYAIDAAEWVS